MAHPLLHRRSFVLSSAAALLGADTIGLPGAARTQTLEPVIVTASTATEALPFFYALDQGWFKKAGLDVKLNLAASGSVVLVALLGDAANIGFTNTLTLTSAVAKGVPMMALAPGTEYDSARPDVRTLVSSTSSIRTAKELGGKTVAVPGLHDAADVATRAWVDQHGGDSSTLHFVEIPGSAMFAALEAGRVDAVTIYDPFAVSMATRGAHTLAYTNDAIASHFLVTAWIAKTSWLDAHRDAAERFAKVMHDSAAYCTAHFKELVPFVAKYSKRPIASLESITPEHYPPGIHASYLQPMIDVAVKYLHIKNFAGSREVFDTPLNTASL